MAQSNIQGLEEWKRWVDSLPEELSEKVKNHVGKTAYKMERDMKMLAPVDTGLLRNSINTTIDIASKGATAIVGTGTIDYAIPVEFGTVKRKATPYFFPIVAKYKPKFDAGLMQILREVGD
jgi:HK97 gp10 family phage protein